MNLNRFLLFLKNVDGVGDTTLRKLIIGNAFNNLQLSSFEDVLNWLKSHRDYFAKKNAVDGLTIDDLYKANSKLNDLEKKSSEHGVKYITYFDKNYPQRFKDMADCKEHDFPIILYYKGDITLLNAEKTCAIIGTRDPSPKATEIGLKLAKSMTKQGYVVISGLAEGCDTLGHKGCLEEGGKTVAIVGTGLDTVYPKSNAGLLNEILEKGGLVISEYPVGFKTGAYAFVERDRLQAAGADKVIVIQTSSNGGTMHAARACVEKYNKELCVIEPSLIDDGNASGNKLLIEQYFARIIDINKN